MTFLRAKCLEHLTAITDQNTHRTFEEKVHAALDPMLGEIIRLGDDGQPTPEEFQARVSSLRAHGLAASEYDLRWDSVRFLWLVLPTSPRHT